MDIRIEVRRLFYVPRVCLKQPAARAVKERYLRKIDTYRFDGDAGRRAHERRSDRRSIQRAVIYVDNVGIQPILTAETRGFCGADNLLFS